MLYYMTFMGTRHNDNNNDKDNDNDTTQIYEAFVRKHFKHYKSNKLTRQWFCGDFKFVVVVLVEVK